MTGEKEHGTHHGDVARTFDAWAADGRGERMEAGHRPTAGRVLEGIPLTSADRFLDLGTGNAWAAREATVRGARVAALDVAPGMLRHARRVTADARVAFLRARFEDLPFRDDAFTRAFSMEAVYYAADVARSLAEIHRVLRAGGTMDAVMDYYVENPASHEWPELTGVRMHLLSESQWVRVFEDAGFRDVDATRVRTPPGVGDAWLQEHGSLHVHAVA